jgi:hypothetical protein
MSCPHLNDARREARELELALWAGGDLPAAEAASLEGHLAGCPECRALAEGLRESQAGLAALAAEPIDLEALARIRRGVLERLEERRPRPAAAPWLYAAAAALALAALALGLWLQGSRPREPRQVAAIPEAAPPAPREAREGGRPETEEPGAASRSRRAAEPSAKIAEAAPGPAPELDPSEPRLPSREAPVPAPPPAPPSPESPVRRAAVTPAPEAATESIVIQIVSDDPDIVFYWLVEPEESEDEAVSS